MVDLNDEVRLRAAIELFYFGYREFTAGPDRILAQRGLSRVHHRILYFVGRHQGVSVKHLTEILAVSKQALNAPLRQLLSMGLVEAQSDPTDARVKRLALSTQGAQLESRLTATQMRMLSSAMLDAGSSGERGWFSVMERLTARASGASSE